jgi:hypothetical protein
MITFILLSHQNINALKEKISNFSSCPESSVQLLVVESEAQNFVLSRLGSILDPRIKIIFDEKSGIYSAMNNGIFHIKTEYYMVVGLDDTFDYTNVIGICNYLQTNKFDLLFLGVRKGLKDQIFFNRDNLTCGPQGIFPSHTGGTVIRTSLHKKYGMYDNGFKVVADGLFLSICLRNGVSAGLYPYVCCTVGDQGFSKKMELLAEWESYKVRRNIGVPFFSSFGLYLFRVSRRLVKRLTLKHPKVSY